MKIFEVQPELIKRALTDSSIDQRAPRPFFRQQQLIKFHIILLRCQVKMSPRVGVMKSFGKQDQLLERKHSFSAMG